MLVLGRRGSQRGEPDSDEELVLLAMLWAVPPEKRHPSPRVPCLLTPLLMETQQWAFSYACTQEIRRNRPVDMNRRLRRGSERDGACVQRVRERYGLSGLRVCRYERVSRRTFTRSTYNSGDSADRQDDAGLPYSAGLTRAVPCARRCAHSRWSCAGTTHPGESRHARRRR